MKNEEALDVDVVGPAEGTSRHGGSEHEDEEPRRSRDVRVELEVRYALNRVARTLQDGEPTAWDTVKLRSYNGGLVGPTIEARPGDTLNIQLHNRLPPEPDMHHPTDPNAPHGFNTTNLHFHGLHVSPSGNADNVLLALPPGAHFHYEVKIPSEHPAGTYWYHAHKHGSATLQLANGMAGALVIRGDVDRVPAIREAKERILVIQQLPYVLTDDPTQPGQQALMVESYANFGPAYWKLNKRRFTLNGVVEPTLHLRPGEVQRWRFVHAGIREMVRVKLVRSEGGQEVALPQYQIAHDGITTGRLEAVQETELHPGYRTDVLVRATDADDKPLPEGTYWLVDTAGVPEARVLARVVVRGSRCRMKLPTERELAPLAPMRTIEEHEVTGTQQAVFAIDLTDPAHPRFLMNGRPFDPDAPPRPLELGAVEEWTVTSQNFGHPFHIHTNPFQLLQNGKVLWKDTLFVGDGQSVKLRTRYERYIGTFMTHCHISEHADLGMALLLEIVPPGGTQHH